MKATKTNNKPLHTPNLLLKNFADEELLSEILIRSGSTKGLPMKAKCFKCCQNFWIKWNQTTGTWSKIHNWEYWSSENIDNKICSSCLRSIRNERSLYLKTIKDTRKRQILSAYLISNRI